MRLPLAVLLLLLGPVLAGCATHAPRCAGALEPINAPAHHPVPAGP